MIFNVIGVLIGFVVLIGGGYYLIKERDDQESKKIYSVVVIIGTLIFIGMIVKSIINL